MDFEQYKAAKAAAGAEGIDFGGVLEQNIHTARSVAQGVTLGYADEIEAWMRSGGGLFTDYTDLRDEIRNEEQAWAQQNPWVANATEIGGAFGTGVYGMGKYVLANAANKGMPYLLKSLGIAAGEGALSSHGHGVSDDPMQQASDMATGGVLGAAGGAAALGAAKGASTLWNNRNAAVRADNKALGTVRKGLNDGGITDADVASRELRNLGDGAVIADIEGMGSKFRPAALDAGEAQVKANQFLRNRAENRPQILRDMAGEVTGIPESPLQYSKRLAAQRRAEANVNYAPIMRNPVDATEPVLRTIDTSAGGKAFKLASDDWLVDTGERITRENAADVTDLNFWNMYQSHLGDAGRAEAKKINSNAKRVRGLSNSRNTVLKELDEQVPDYVDARRTYAKQYEAEEAIELGRKSIESTKLDPVDMLDDVKAMGADQRKAFLKGVMGAVESRIRRAPDSANTALKILRTPGLRERITAAFGNDKKAGSQFLARLRQQAKMGETESGVLYGSRTAPMQNEANAAGQMLNAGLDVAGGNQSLYGAAVNAAKQNMPTTIDHAGNSLLMDKMLSGGSTGDAILRNALRQSSPWMGTAATGAAIPAGAYGMENQP